jgi:predicted amidohydrolase YtcJ
VYVQLFYRAALLTPEGYARLGIASDADVPPKGRVERDGWIAGDAATLVALFDRLPRPSPAQAMEGTTRFFRELNRLGITGVVDPGGLNLRAEDYTPLFVLASAGQLSVRVAYSLFALRDGKELEDFQAGTRSLPMGTRGRDGMLIFNGIGERVTFGMYNNDSPTEAQKDAYFRVARWAAAQGLTLTQHWPNNASVHHLLEVVERVDREVKIAPLRWSIAHVHDATPETLARMKALGVGWLMQNGLHFAAPSYLNARSKETLTRIPPIATALRMGVPVGGGTDAHRVMGYNPFVSLKWMLDGRTVTGTPTRGPAEIPSRTEALRIYTKGSAWFSFDEDRRGTLEPGKLADLAVLSRDYLRVPLAELPETESLLTLVGGRVVYAAPPFVPR